MEELNLHNRISEKERIESVAKKEQEKEFKYESSLSPYKGHKVFAIKLSTLEVKTPKYRVQEIINIMDWINGVPHVLRKEIVREKGYIYISALNKKSALERYKSGRGSAIKKNLGEKLFQL